MAITRTRIRLRQKPASGIELLVLSTDRHQESFDPSKSRGTSESNDCGNGTVTDVPAPLPTVPVALAFNELVAIFPRVTNLFKRADNVLNPSSLRFETELRPLRVEVYTLRSELLAWSSRQPEDIRPVTIKRFTQPYSICFTECRELVCPTFRTDRYADCK